MTQKVFILRNNITFDVVGVFTDLQMAKECLIQNANVRDVKTIQQIYGNDFINEIDWDMFCAYTDYDIECADLIVKSCK